MVTEAPFARTCCAPLAALVLVLAAVLATGARARAEDVVVVALGGNATEAERAPVLDEVVTRFRADGFAVLGPGELVHRVPPSRLALASTEDAARLATEVGTPRVACVSVWSNEGAVTELAMSLHALSGGRSVRSATASGTVTGERSASAIVAEMVAQVLAAERAAAMLDPGIGGSGGSSQGGGAGQSGSGGAGQGGGSSQGGGAGQSGAVGGGQGASGSGGQGASGSGGQGGAGGESRGGPEPLFGILGPGLLAAVGAAGIGLGIWASLDPTCDLRGEITGVCLRGEENNLGVGILLIATGTLSLAGAIVWWVTDAQAPPMEPRIDVVIGPGGAGVRGTF